MAKNTKPTIRFKGFTDAWEQRKLREVLISLQNNTLSRADLSYEQGVAKNVHYGDILVRFGEAIDVKTEQLPMFSDEKIIAKYKSSFLQNGDVIVADTAEDETVGKCTEIAGLSDEVVISGLHTIPYRPLVKFASGYLGYYMNSASYHRQLLPLMQGIKVTSISKSTMQNTEIYYPKSETEQEKIGTYFRELDHLITLHQRKYDSLVNVKKAMLEKMFPKNGETVPEIRFKGFTDAWEQRKVGELIEDYIEKTIVQNQYPVLTSSQQQGIVFQEEYFADRQVTTNDNIGYYVLPYGYFTYRSRSDTDIFVFNRNTLINKGIISYYYPVFYPKKCNSNFLLRRLNYGIRKQLSMAAEGTGQKVLAHNKFKNMVVDVPKLNEQERIGSLFSNLDNLITLHQRKLEKLKNIKKSCLEKMFV